MDLKLFSFPTGTVFRCDRGEFNLQVMWVFTPHLLVPAGVSHNQNQNQLFIPFNFCGNFIYLVQWEEELGDCERRTKYKQKRHETILGKYFSTNIPNLCNSGLSWFLVLLILKRSLFSSYVFNGNNWNNLLKSEKHWWKDCLHRSLKRRRFTPLLLKKQDRVYCWVKKAKSVYFYLKV